MCVFIRKTANVEFHNENYKKLWGQRNCVVTNLLLIVAGTLQV